MTLDAAIEKYYNIIHRYIYGKTAKDQDFADECTNNVFFLFSLKAEEIADPAVYPWLVKTATNKTKEYFRKKSKESIVTYIDDMPYEPSDNTDICDMLITDADIAVAKDKVLSLLSKTERELYDCYFNQKMTYIEIANKYGIDRNTASKRLHVISKKLEDEARKMFMIGGTATVMRIIAALFDR